MLNATISEHAKEEWRLFRARSIFFQLKIIAALIYVAIVIATLLFVLKPRNTGPNDLDALITVLPGDPIMGRYFIIQNTSDYDWLNVSFTIDGDYKTHRDVVMAGKKITLYLHDFTREEEVEVKLQTTPPPSKKIKKKITKKWRKKSKRHNRKLTPEPPPMPPPVEKRIEAVSAPANLQVTFLRIESRGQVTVFPIQVDS
ncbi:MAG: hypothetical protein JW841_05140 [Deltaproteobacteria bacterium]|nr:hypothetical protein [Deltaproteobacteria bacterium]